MAHSQVYYSQRTKPLVKLLERLAYSHSRWEAFSDFLKLSACSISNAVDPIHREERERQYMETVGRYTHDEVQLFPQMLAELIAAMQICSDNGHMEDLLGKVFHELELHNKYHGQFFTPQNVSDMMGEITAGGQSLAEEKSYKMGEITAGEQSLAEEKGYETMCESCIGSGAMVLGFINAHRKNTRRPVVVTGVDSNLKCVHMAYLQLSLYGIPAVVIHGNSLTCEEWSRWYSPIYVAKKWVFRQHCGITRKDEGMEGLMEDEKLKLATEPMYAAMRAIQRLMAEPTELPKETTKPYLENNPKPLSIIDLMV